MLRLPSLAALSFLFAAALHAQSISTGLTLSGPSTGIAGHAVTLTVTLSVSSGPVSATNGLQVVFATPGGGGGTATLQNGVATAGINIGCSDLHGCSNPVAVSFAPQGNFGPSSAQTTILAVQPASIDGRFAFLFQGHSTPGVTADDTVAIGSLTFNNGSFLDGEEDLNSPSGASQKLPLTGSSVVSADGSTLSLTLQSSLGAQSFTVFLPYTSVSSYGHAANGINISFVSAPGSPITGSGIMTAQGSPANPAAGVFIFNANGQSACSDCQSLGHPSGPVSLAGQLFLNISSSGGGSVLASETIGGEAYPSVSVDFTATAVDANGRFTLTLTPSPTTFADQPTHYAAYQLDANHLYLMSTDPHTKAILLDGAAVAEPVPLP